MAKQLNVHDRNSLYNLGWFPVPTLNKYVQRNVDKKIFKLKRLNRDYKTQLYFSLRPRCFKLYKTKIPKVLRLDICFKQSGKLTAKHTELREKIEIMYAQFIYKNFLKRELMKDRNKFILD
jgi:hypothetical protein